MYDPLAVPHSKDTVTLLTVASDVRSPFRVAEVVATLVASLVVTNGVGAVVNCMSGPYAVPLLPTALTLKW